MTERLLLSVCVRQYLEVLICILSIINNVEHFFLSAYWPLVYLLWRNVYSNPLPIFKLNYSFFIVVLKGFIIYSGH